MAVEVARQEKILSDSASTVSTIHDYEHQPSSPPVSEGERDIEKGVPKPSVNGEPLEQTISRKSAKPNALTTTLSRTLSRVRTSDNIDPGPPPDGGWTAWSQALLTHLVIFNTWGFM